MLSCGMAGVGFAGFIFVLFLVMAIVLPIWVYSDAQENSPHSAVLWALVTFFGGIVGLLLYVILGRKPGGRGGRGDHGSHGGREY